MGQVGGTMAVVGARLARWAVLLMVVLAGCGEPAVRGAASEGDVVFVERRRQLIAEIRASDRGISAPVLAAVERVDRRRFVRPENVDEAYENRPLPIGEGRRSRSR